MPLPKLFIPNALKGNYETNQKYLCTIDRDERNTHRFIGADGNEWELYTANHLSNDARRAHPMMGTVVSATDGAQFQPGDILICKHFTFSKKDKEGDRIWKVFYEEGDQDYYQVMNHQVMFGIRNGELIPREGILLCEPVYGKFVETDLYLTSDFEGNRRDIAKVIKTWPGCTDYKEGDYLLLADGGDYPFTFKGKEVLKVDTFFNDVWAVVDSPDWRIKKIRKHVTDHAKPHTPFPDTVR